MQTESEKPPAESDVPSATPSNSRTPRPWTYYLKRSLRSPDTVMGGTIPVGLFFVTRQATGDEVSAALVAGAWSLAVMVRIWWRQRRVNVFAAFALTILVVLLVTTLAFQDSDYYLASAALERLLYGLLFLLSLLRPRSLIQIIVEETSGDFWSAEFRATPRFRRPWQIVTTVWGVEYLLHAAVLLIIQATLPRDTYLVLRMLLSWTAALALIAFAFWYPGVYWQRTRQQSDQSTPPGNC